MPFGYDPQMGARNDTKTIGATAEVISAAKRRSVFVFTNYSAGGQTITLSFGRSASAGQGIILYPTESYYEATGDNFPIYEGDISAIASGAGALLAIYER